MNNNLRIFVFIFLSSLLIARANAQTTSLPFPDPDVTISMDFQDASLKNILKVFSIQSGLNFIASEAVQERKITLYLDKVPIKDAMDKLFKANNLYYELDKQSNIFIVKDWGKPQVDTITKIYNLKYQNVPGSNIQKEKSLLASEGSQGTAGSSTSGQDIVECIKQVLSENGKINENPRTNSLVITDIPSNFQVIEQIIATLDVPQPQVMLEVEILDVSKGLVDKLGFDFSGAGSYAIQVVSASRGISFPLSAYNPSDNRIHDPITSGTLSFPTNLKLVFDFLRTQSDTKTLARPKILTLNNETAEIKITTKESVNPSTTTNTDTGTSTTGVEREETGVSLRVTPQINPDGEITMFIFPRVADTKSGLTVGGITYKDPEERSTKSIVRLKDNDTVIVGGLIRNEYSQTLTKIPVLGDIPLLGALFRHKDKDKDKERELLIFITPHIIKEDNLKTTQTKNIAILEREQEPGLELDKGKI